MLVIVELQAWELTTTTTEELAANRANRRGVLAVDDANSREAEEQLLQVQLKTNVSAVLGTIEDQRFNCTTSVQTMLTKPQDVVLFACSLDYHFHFYGFFLYKVFSVIVLFIAVVPEGFQALLRVISIILSTYVSKL